MRTATLLFGFLGRLGRAAGFGPTARTPRPWRLSLVIVVAAAASLQLTDALTTFLLLTDPGRPYTIEANPLVNQLLQHGWAIFALAKLMVALTLLGLVHYALRRGLPRTAYALGCCGILIGGGATAFNGLQLLTGPLLF